MAVVIDQPVADFQAQATSGTSVSLAVLRGQQVLIYFYPKDSTPGCTTEGQGFRDRYADFQAANTLIFGVSRDSLKSHENFKCKQAFPFELISDADEALYLSSADWMTRNMLGRIEVAWPVRDSALRQRVIDECLVPYLHDTLDAWTLQPDGQYRRVGTKGRSAQQALMRRFAPSKE